MGRRTVDRERGRSAGREPVHTITPEAGGTRTGK